MTTQQQIAPPRPTAGGLLDILRGTAAPPPPCTLVVFGANGDLMEKREGRLALTWLADHDQLDSVIPVAGHPVPARQYLKVLHDGDKDSGPISDTGYQKFVKATHLDNEAQLPGINVSQADGVAKLKPKIGNRSAVFYASLPPSLYAPLLSALKQSGMADEPDGGFRRVVLEKPFGTDLKSAQALHEQIQRDFRKGQILLVDHFLAYPGMLNLLSLRLHPDVNEMLSSEYVERVEVLVLETIKSNDRPYFRAAGELIDLVQNHDMQLISTLVCPLPGNLTGVALQQARADVVKQLRIDRATVVRAQFDGFNDPAQGAPADAKPSDAETFIAFGFQVDLPRWQKVPFSLISAKGVAERRFGADVHLRRLPPVLAKHLGVSADTAATFSLTVHPGQSFWMTIGDHRIDFPPDDRIPDVPPHARLISDAMKGDHALFVDPPAAIAAWDVTEQIRASWGPLRHYPVGTKATTIAERRE